MSRREDLDVRLYRRLVLASPELRPAADDVVETYLDLRAEAVERGGRFGLLRWAVRTLGVLLVIVLAERLTRPRSLSDLGGLLGAAGRTWLREARFALRGLARHPGYALAVVVIVALGIAATTTVFSVVDAVLLRPLPYPEADRLVLFTLGDHPGPLFRLWEAESAFETVTPVWADDAMDLTGDGEPVRVEAARVEPSFFDLFDLGTVHGRPLVESDLEGERVVVLSHGLWSRRFAADPGVVDATITLDGEPWTVVGVLREDVRLPEAAVGSSVDLLRPLDWSHPWLENWSFQLLGAVGRLAPGVGVEGAQVAVDAVAERVAGDVPRYRREDGSARTSPLVPLHEATVGSVRDGLRLLLGAVGFMLAIACANLANLCLARGSDREHEVALRRALGASRFQVVRQLLVESTVLACLGGGAGLLLTTFGLRVFERLRPADLPRFGEVAIDLRVAGFALLAALVCGLVFGAAPALQAAGVEARRSLESRTRTGVSRRTSLLRSALVVAEIALALVLLAGAALLGHSLLGLARTDPGFEPERVVRLDLRLGASFGSDEEQEERARWVGTLVDEMRAVPGVEDVGAGWTLPFDVTGTSRCCWATGFTPREDLDRTEDLLVQPVTPGFHATLGMRPLAGRLLEVADAEAEPAPVVLSSEAARMLFPDDRDPVGRSLRMGPEGPDEVETRVVGLVADVLHFGMDQAPEPTVYVPYGRFGGGLGRLSVGVRLRAPLDDAIAAALRDTIWALDPSIPIGGIEPAEEMIWSSLRTERFYSSLFAVFGAMALALAALGLATSLLYAVSRRHREMGIRLAVGASATDLLRLVVGQGLALAAGGLVLGLAAAMALSRVLGGLVHDLGTLDPPSLAVAAGVLALAALGASFVPATVASRTDPAVTLRGE